MGVGWGGNPLERVRKGIFWGFVLNAVWLRRNGSFCSRKIGGGEASGRLEREWEWM